LSTFQIFFSIFLPRENLPDSLLHLAQFFFTLLAK
jgi:hypothetical protein